MKFDEIHICRLKFSTTFNVNDNTINIQKYQCIRAVSLITFSTAMGQIPRSTERILLPNEYTGLSEPQHVCVDDKYMINICFHYNVFVGVFLHQMANFTSK